MNNHGQKSSDHCQNKNNTNLNTCRQRTGFCTSGTYQIQKRLLFRSLRSKRSIDHACVKQLSLLNVYNKLRKHCEAYHTPLILLSEMQFMQHKNHQFNIGIAWNTHYKTKPQCQKKFQFHILSADFVFVYGARCTCTPWPILHHEHCHRPSEPFLTGLEPV